MHLPQRPSAPTLALHSSSGRPVGQQAAVWGGVGSEGAWAALAGQDMWVGVQGGGQRVSMGLYRAVRALTLVPPRRCGCGVSSATAVPRLRRPAVNTAAIFGVFLWGGREKMAALLCAAAVAAAAPPPLVKLSVDASTVTHRLRKLDHGCHSVRRHAQPLPCCLDPHQPPACMLGRTRGTRTSRWACTPSASTAPPSSRRRRCTRTRTARAGSTRAAARAAAARRWTRRRPFTARAARG